MCQALKEWAEEERSIGREEGADDKTRVMVKNMLLRGMPDDDIMAIAECDWAFVDKVRMEL